MYIMSPASLTAAIAANKFHCIIYFGTPCIIQMNDGVHRIKTKNNYIKLS